MSKHIKKTKVISHGRKLRHIINNADIPGSYIGRSLGIGHIEVPVDTPNTEDGAVTTEFAYWSGVQDFRTGTRYGFVSAIVLMTLLFVAYQIVQGFIVKNDHIYAGPDEAKAMGYRVRAIGSVRDNSLSELVFPSTGNVELDYCEAHDGWDSVCYSSDSDDQPKWFIDKVD